MYVERERERYTFHTYVWSAEHHPLFTSFVNWALAASASGRREDDSTGIAVLKRLVSGIGTMVTASLVTG